MLFFLSFFTLLTPHFTFAYLDPGTGSFIIHIIVGGIVGISYGVRVFWRNIKDGIYYIAGRRTKAEQNSQSHNEESV